MDIYIWIIIGAPLLFLFLRTAWDLFFGYLAYRRNLVKDAASLVPVVANTHFISRAN